MATDTVKIVKEDFGSFLRLNVEGTVNESLTADMLVGYADGRPVVIDLSKVTRITSFGVRQWIRALGSLREKVPMVFLDRCSYSTVSQLNMIQGFASKCVVVSVYAPMTCGSCNHEEKILIDVRNGPPQIIDAKCSSCKAATELDEDMASFFHFAVAHHVDPAEATHVAWCNELVELRSGATAVKAAPAMASVKGSVPVAAPVPTPVAPKPVAAFVPAAPVSVPAPTRADSAFPSSFSVGVPAPVPGPSFAEKKPAPFLAEAGAGLVPKNEPARSGPVSLNIDADQLNEIANLVAAKVSVDVVQNINKAIERRGTWNSGKNTISFKSHNILPEIIAFLVGVGFAVAYFAIVG